MTVNVPLGWYDHNLTANVGGNRWAFTPLVNFNYTPDKGVSWFDGYASVRFFTDNKKFQGDKTLRQKPLLTLTGHYSRNIGKKSWAAIGTNYDYGGESSIDNVPQNNKANGIRPIVSFNRRVGRFSITVRYENTSTRATDARHNGQIGIRVATLLQRWTRLSRLSGWNLIHTTFMGQAVTARPNLKVPCQGVHMPSFFQGSSAARRLDNTI